MGADAPELIAKAAESASVKIPDHEATDAARFVHRNARDPEDEANLLAHLGLEIVDQEAC